jgi:hypothetical protein
VFISDRILGHYYIAEINRKGGDMLAWSLVPAAFDGRITRVPSRAVPRKVWKQAYRLLIEVAS